MSENRSNIKVRSRIMMVTTLRAGKRQLIDEKITLPAIRTDSTRMKEGEEEEIATYTYCSATTRQFEGPGRKHVSQIGHESDSVTCRLLNLAKERFPCTASHGVHDSDVLFFVQREPIWSCEYNFLPLNIGNQSQYTNFLCFVA